MLISFWKRFILNGSILFLVLASDKCAFTKCRFKVQFLLIFSRSMLILVDFFSMYIYKPMRDACYAEVYCVEKLGAKLES
jgi:hypothetical protein